MPKQASLFTGPLVATAARDALVKLDPRSLIRTAVMFVNALGGSLSTVLSVRSLAGLGGDPAFEGQLVFWLWLTVLFGNFAEALAEGRGKAQAASLRATKGELTGKLITAKGTTQNVAATALKVGDIVLVENGD